MDKVEVARKYFKSEWIKEEMDNYNPAPFEDWICLKALEYKSKAEKLPIHDVIGSVKLCKCPPITKVRGKHNCLHCGRSLK